LNILRAINYATIGYNFTFRICNVLQESGELVRCKFELNRGMDYRVKKYDSGNRSYLLNDFIILQENVADDNKIPIVTELSKSKWKSVERASVVIINTRQAELDMIISPYPECREEQLIISWDITDTSLIRSRNIKLSRGAVYIKHTTGLKHRGLCLRKCV